MDKEKFIEFLIFEIEEEIKKSVKEKNRTGDYRIGLKKASYIIAHSIDKYKEKQR